MTNSLASSLPALLAFIQAFSFSAHNLKGYPGKTNLVSTSLYALFTTASLALGKTTGGLFADAIPLLSTQAGAAFLIVLALKFFIRGWKTKPLQRVFDMSQTRTTIGLALAANIDLLLLSIASAILSHTTWGSSFTIPLLTGICGLFTGLLLAKKTSITLPNLLDIIMAIVMMTAGAYLWIS